MEKGMKSFLRLWLALGIGGLVFAIILQNVAPTPDLVIYFGIAIVGMIMSFGLYWFLKYAKFLPQTSNISADEALMLHLQQLTDRAMIPLNITIIDGHVSRGLRLSDRSFISQILNGHWHYLRMFDPMANTSRHFIFDCIKKLSYGEIRGVKIDDDPLKACEKISKHLEVVEKGVPQYSLIPDVVKETVVQAPSNQQNNSQSSQQ